MYLLLCLHDRGPTKRKKDLKMYFDKLYFADSNEDYYFFNEMYFVGVPFKVLFPVPIVAPFTTYTTTGAAPLVSHLTLLVGHENKR